MTQVNLHLKRKGETMSEKNTEREKHQIEQFVKRICPFCKQEIYQAEIIRYKHGDFKLDICRCAIWSGNSAI